MDEIDKLCLLETITIIYYLNRLNSQKVPTSTINNVYDLIIHLYTIVPKVDICTISSSKIIK